MATALTFRVKSVFIDAIQSCLEKTGLSVNAALKEIIASAIGLNHRRSNVSRNNLAEHPKRFKCVFAKIPLIVISIIE